MTSPLACLRCGEEGADVSMAFVDLESEAHEDGEPLGTVTVAIVDGEDRRTIRGMAYAEVPARFGFEPRCNDRDACGRRVRAGRQPVPPAAGPASDGEESVPWL